MSKAYRDNYRLIDFSKDLSVRRAAKPAPKRSALGFPMVISDTMEPTEHVDGRFYTSKQAFRAVTKREGLIEIGTEKLPKPVRQRGSRAERMQAIKTAAEKLSAAR